MIYFELNRDWSLVELEWIDGASVLELNASNWEIHLDKINKCIEVFNSEMYWDHMWGLPDCKVRFAGGDRMYILLVADMVTGFVWYKGNMIYNTFVSSTRPEGASHWFINQTIKSVLDMGYGKITLWADSWNERAINFWKKVGFRESF
jgi:hypothetical protein